GVLIYMIGRGNGRTLPSSMLLTAGESVAWEYLAEYREKPSINDMVNNPFGGMAVGEPFFQLSEFFSRGRDNFINPTLAALFSPISAVNGWADHRRLRPAPDTDPLGLPRDVWHRFVLYGGFSNPRWRDSSR